MAGNTPNKIIKMTIYVWKHEKKAQFLKKWRKN